MSLQWGEGWGAGNDKITFHIPAMQMTCRHTFVLESHSRGRLAAHFTGSL